MADVELSRQQNQRPQDAEPLVDNLQAIERTRKRYLLTRICGAFSAIVILSGSLNIPVVLNIQGCISIKIKYKLNLIVTHRVIMLITANASCNKAPNR